jgi:hypothetical protein
VAGERRLVLSLALIFLVSLPAVTTRLYSSDEIEYFAWVRSLWFDRDLSFDNEYRYFYERGVAQGARVREDGTGLYGGSFRRTFLEATTPTGLRINFAPIGSALLWSPFYILADTGVRIARALGSPVAADGFSQPYITATTYASALYGLLAIVLSLVAVRRISGAVDWTFGAIWLGTPLVFYMYVAPGFSHATSAFVVAAFYVAWLHVREQWSLKGVAALGAIAGVMAMVREQDVFIAIGPALDYAVHAVRAARGGTTTFRVSVGRAAAGIAAFVVCFLPQAISYLVLYGRLGPHQSVEQKMHWLAPYALQVLASPTHGFVFWTPLAVPALTGLVLLALGRASRDPSPGGTASLAWIGAVSLLMAASQIYVSGSVASWEGGAFGQRRLVSLTVFLVIGLASLFRVVRSTWPRRALVAVVVICTWWNLALVAQFGTGLMNRQRLELSTNAYHAFITVPRALPELAWRYVFDRQSFYRGRGAAGAMEAAPSLDGR